MLSNEWQVFGNFMYPPDVPGRLVELVASGQLDLSRVASQQFALEAFEAALEAASKMRGLDSRILIMSGTGS